MNMTDRDWLSRGAVLFVAVVLAPALNAQDEISNAMTADAERLRQVAIPKVEDGHFALPPLAAPTIATKEIGNGRVPDGFRGDDEAPAQPLPESADQRGEVWNWSVCNWVAADTFSNPRYFEDRMLERHGQERCGVLQPVASGARFFVTVPMLPYLMAIREPCDREYTLGYYRSGSPVPVMLQRPPYERRAMLTEAAVAAGAIIAFP